MTIGIEPRVMAESDTNIPVEGKIEGNVGPETGVDRDALRAAALELLARRDHSARELSEKLSRRFRLSAQHPALTSLLQHLQALDYQNDARFAAMLVRSRQQQGYGPQRVIRELRQRGIATALIEEVLDVRDPCWTELAVALVKRRQSTSRLTSASAGSEGGSSGALSSEILSVDDLPPEDFSVEDPLRGEALPEDAPDDVDADRDQPERARRFASRRSGKRPSSAKTSAMKARARLVRFLQYRGFTASQISAALRG